MLNRSWPAAFVVAFAAAAAAPAAATTTLATNPAGRQVLLFQPQRQSTRPLFAATRAPSGRFTQLRAIAPGTGVLQMRAAVDDAGGAVAAWNSQDPHAARADKVFTSIETPGRAFGAPAKLLEGAPKQGFGFAANAAGDTIVAHTGDTFRGSGDRYAFRPRGATFEPTQTLPPSFAPVCSAWLSVDADGTAHCFAQTVGIHGGVDVEEYVRPAHGDFGPPQKVAHIPAPGGATFASSRNGRVLFAYAQRARIKGIERAPGGAFSRPFVIAQGFASSDPKRGPTVARLALSASGNVIASIRSRGSFRIAVGKPSGAFVQTTIHRSADVAVDDRGDAAAVWAQHDHSVRAIYRTAGAKRFHKPIVLAGARPSARGFEWPTVVLARSGRATAAWEQSNGHTVSVLTRDFRATKQKRRQILGTVRVSSAHAKRPARAVTLAP